MNAGIEREGERPRFSAWGEGARMYGIPIVVGIGLLVAGIWVPIAGATGGVCVAFGLFTVFFFRDPNRTIPSGDGVVVGPADGKVVLIDEPEDSPHYEGPCKRVAIFLSLFNVHVNRAPFAGTVVDTSHQPGGYLNAAKLEAGDQNEAMTIRMDTARGPMTVRQIAGLVARRIVCPLQPGDELATGERFGMIKFGSRTELYLPLDAQICVKMGETVRGGSTVIARFS